MSRSLPKKFQKWVSVSHPGGPSPPGRFASSASVVAQGLEQQGEPHGVSSERPGGSAETHPVGLIIFPELSRGQAPGLLYHR